METRDGSMYQGAKSMDQLVQHFAGEREVRGVCPGAIGVKRLPRRPAQKSLRSGPDAGGGAGDRAG